MPRSVTLSEPLQKRQRQGVFGDRKSFFPTLVFLPCFPKGKCAALQVGTLVFAQFGWHHDLVQIEVPQ